MAIYYFPILIQHFFNGESIINLTWSRIFENPNISGTLDVSDSKAFISKYRDTFLLSIKIHFILPIVAFVNADSLGTIPRMNIPTHFGGSGKDEWAWALCDAPMIIYALLKLGIKNKQIICKEIKLKRIFYIH